MRRFFIFIREEYAYFQKLGSDAQHLLLSYVLTGITDPILFIFLNAFLWERSNNLLLLAWYNASMFLGLPLGFYLNGQFLKKYSPTKMYLIGCLSQGIVASLLFFFSLVTYPFLFFFGLTFGIATAFYWANRNLLSLRTTNSENRIYFSSLESTLATPISIVMPFIIGWFIYFGRIVHLYTLNQAYQLLATFAIFVLFFVGLVVRNVKIELSPIRHLIVRKASNHWHLYRLYTIFSGLQGGIAIFLPTIMILSFLGKENVVGTIQGIASIFSAIAIYFVGRFASSSSRVQIFFISFILLLLSGLSFGIFFSGLGVLLYFVFSSLQAPFGWAGASSLSQDTIDTEEEDSLYNHYAFVFDEEIFLNTGRIAGVIVFFLLVTQFSSSFALRFSPFLLGTSQILLVFIVQILDKKNLRN